MAELKPCPVCGKRPGLIVRKVDIPEAEELYPVAALRCDCKVAEAIALTDEEAVMDWWLGKKPKPKELDGQINIFEQEIMEDILRGE